MNNDQLIAQMEGVLNTFNIRKADDGGTTDLNNTNFGGILPLPVVRELMSLTRDQSHLLSAITYDQIDRQAGKYTMQKVNGNIAEGISTNDGTPAQNNVINWNVPYSCKPFVASWYVEMRQLREAKAAGINFEQQTLKDFAIALKNDFVKMIISSDTSLDDKTSLNRMLRMFNGVLVQANQANVFDAQGLGFGQGAFEVILSKMPDEYRDDPNLHWIYGNDIETAWISSLQNVNTTERMRSAVGDDALVSRKPFDPWGRPALVVPQMPSTQGPAALAPTSVTDNGANITFRVNSILADATDFTAREVQVLNKVNGIVENCFVTRNGSNQNIITTVGLLGQNTGSVSTTLADYTVIIHDEAQILYGNPKGIVFLTCYGIRSYRKFNPERERWEIITHFDADCVMPAPELFVNMKRISVPRKKTWTPN